MNVEFIYRKPDGSETALGSQELDHMPPTGEPFLIEGRQFIATAYFGPDSEGRYRLCLEDDPGATRQ